MVQSRMINFTDNRFEAVFVGFREDLEATDCSNGVFHYDARIPALDVFLEWWSDDLPPFGWAWSRFLLCRWVEEFFSSSFFMFVSNVSVFLPETCCFALFHGLSFPCLLMRTDGVYVKANSIQTLNP